MNYFLFDSEIGIQICKFTKIINKTISDVLEKWKIIVIPQKKKIKNIL